METAADPTRSGFKQNRAFVLSSLSLGHGVSHLLGQGFSLLFVDIAATMGLSTFQKATIFAVRQVGSGAVNLGGGPFVDMLKAYWGPILTGCMALHAVAFVLMGASPNFVFLIFPSILFAVPGSLWHLPSLAALSQRFPDKRGFAVGIHGSGGNMGNVLGPLLAAGLLALMVWQHVFYIYAIPSLLFAVFVWWSLKDLGKQGSQEKQKALGAQFHEALNILKNPIVLGLILAAMLRGVGLNAVNNWTPFYLKDPVADGGLSMGSLEAGLFLSLLAGVGIISTPVLGYMSDKIGRKTVLVPGFFLAAGLSWLVVWAGDSLWLIPVMAGMGVFSFSLHQIIQAMVLDAVGRGEEAKAIGLVFGINGTIGIGTPFITSLVIDYLGGLSSIYYYSAILTAGTGVIIWFLPIRPLRPVVADPI